MSFAFVRHRIYSRGHCLVSEKAYHDGTHFTFSFNACVLRMAGLMYFQVDDSITGVFDRYASLFFGLAALIFTPAYTAATIWDAERLLLR